MARVLDPSAGAPADPSQSYPWWRRALISVDQTANVWIFEWLFWSEALPDETISSHAGRLMRDGKANWAVKLVCRICNVFQTGHCGKSIGA